VVFVSGDAPFEVMHPLASRRQINRPAIRYPREPGELIGN
jgi:hypothetical protein